MYKGRCHIVGVLLFMTAALTAGCGGMNQAASQGESSSPNITATQNPLVAQFTYATPRAATVSVEFGTDTTYGRNTSSQASPAGGQATILVAGMHPSTTYHMRAVLDFSDGTQEFGPDQTFTTGSVPPNRLSNLTVTRPAGLTPASGIELLDLVAGTPNQLLAEATDLDGSLCWYYEFSSANGVVPFPIKPEANGHFLVILAQVGAPIGKGIGGILREIDLAGNTIKEITLDQLNSALSAGGFNVVATSMHHDALDLPNGHVLILVNDTRTFNNLQGFAGQNVQVFGDDIVDLDANFKPVWVWSAFDHLDINRHPLLFPPDWTHANALLYSPDDGNILLSLAHQSWIIKIDYEDGRGTSDIIWKLGYQGDFTIDTGNPADWMYGQHGPNFVGPDTSGVFQLGVFDDGLGRVLDQNGTVCGASGAPACYSRAVTFEISEAAKTVHIVWQDTPLPYSMILGNALQLSNGDMEFDLGFLTGSLPGKARVEEVTNEAVPQVVWQLDIQGQAAYRVFRMPSLYPGVSW